MPLLLCLLLSSLVLASPLAPPAAPAATTTAAALVADGCPASADSLPPGDHFDPVDPRLQGTVAVVLKSLRRVALYQAGALQQCWPAGLASTYVPGTKRRRGDMRTPEGWYRTSDKPWSQFYGAIAVHYPDADDAEAGLAAGLVDTATVRSIEAAVKAGRKPPQNTRLGGEILIHGGGGSSDWTLGCVALDDAHLDALRAALPSGMNSAVLILP